MPPRDCPKQRRVSPIGTSSEFVLDSLAHWYWARPLRPHESDLALAWGSAHLHRDRMKWEEYLGMESDKGRICVTLSPSDSD